MEVKSTERQRVSIDIEKLLRREASSGETSEARSRSGPDRAEISREAQERLEEERRAEEEQLRGSSRRRGG